MEKVVSLQKFSRMNRCTHSDRTSHTNSGDAFLTDTSSNNEFPHSLSASQPNPRYFSVPPRIWRSKGRKATSSNECEVSCLSEARADITRVEVVASPCDVIVHYDTSAMKLFLMSVSSQHDPKASNVITLVKKKFFARASYEILHHEVWKCGFPHAKRA